MEWHAFVISVILLLVVSDSNARSLEQVCTRSCESNDVRKFFAKNDFEYTYNYQALVESSFHATTPEGEKARFKLNADFSIITSTDCNLVLQINRGVHIDNRRPETRDERDWQRAVTAHPLYFQWENGVVKQVCPAADDPIWVVNFKRGILSAIQSTADQTSTGVQELDVSGTCESDYLVQKQGHSNVEIRKTKDYSTCENRNEHLLFSWSMPYEMDSLRQNYIESHQRCVQTVGDVLLNVRCDEDHTFRPFSTEDAGAKSTITQTITFQSQRYLRSYEAEEFPMRKTTLKYENEDDISSLSMQEKTTVAKQILNEICTNMGGKGYHLVSKDFMRLASAVRELDAESLNDLSRHTSTCAEYSSALSQMLENTLPFCGTEGCVTFASRLILQGELSDDLAQRWLFGFGLIKQPTAGMITSVLEIVENNRFPQQSYLSIGSMIQQFCENSQGDCMDNTEIRTAVEVIMQHLGSNCHSVSEEGRMKTILALKAIGNAGHTTSVPTLKRCAAETLNNMEARVASLDAFRRMPCGTDRSGLVTILENTMEDSELRIAAYRNLMHCPTDQLLIKIKALLETEENEQVGSYIWSHLNAVKESSDPLKVLFQEMLRPHKIRNFERDFRKYSKYQEIDLFSKKFNSGGSADASIVWSSKSFIPRSVSTNVTIHMFGQAINLFELGGRIEGAEDYLQSILEPENYEKRQASANMISTESRHRTNARQIRPNKMHLSAFMRVFGKELAYYNNEMTTAQESQDSGFWTDVMSKFMSTDGYNYHDDTLVMDSTHTLPTGLGMPLYLSYKGSSSIDLRAKGSLDMGRMAQLEYSINGKFTPRAAVTMTGSMVIDSRVRKTGIATESVAFTSTSLGGSVILKNGGRKLDLELESPNERNWAMNFKHTLLRVEGEHTEELSRRDSEDTTTCTEEKGGQRLCYTNSYSGEPADSLILPRSGQVEISVYSEKTDPTFTKYTASISKNTVYDNEDDILPSNLFLQLDFDTPGSAVNRKAVVMASYSIPEKQISVLVTKGEEVSRLQGYYISTEDSKVLKFSADFNGDSYSFEANVARMLGDEQKTASAGVVITTPQNVMNAETSLVYRPGESMLGTFEMNNILPSPVLMKVDLKDLSATANALRFSGNVVMKVQPFINSKLVVDMEVNPDWKNIGFSVNYKIGESPKESVTFYHKRTSVEREGETQWGIDHLLSSTQFDNLNYKIALNHGFSASAISSSLDVAFGPKMLEASNTYKAHFGQEYSNDSNSTATAFSGHVVSTVPFLNMNKELKASYVNTDRALAMNVEGISGAKNQYAKFTWESNAPGSLIHHGVDFEVYATAIGKWTLKSNLDESPEHVYSVKSTLSLGTTDELQFVQSASFANLPSNKTIRFDLAKGGTGNGIVQFSSENIAEQATPYYSKNFLQVTGYESRGLNLYMNVIPQGYSTSVEFLQDSKVSVGAEYSFKTTDHGRHIVMSVTQHDVQPLTISLKSGFEFVASQMLDTYVDLAQNEAPILSTKVIMKTLDSGSKYANVTVKVQEHDSLSFSRGIDFYTSLAASDENGYSADLIHRNNNKKINFHLESDETGFHGSVDQTYLMEVDPVTFKAGLTATGVLVTLTDNAHHESTFEVSIEETVVTAKWGTDMLMLKEYAPRNAKVIFRSFDDGFRLDTNSEKKSFDVIYRNRWPKLHHFELTNTLIPTLPETILSKSSYKKSVLDVNAKYDSSTFNLNVNTASSDKFVVTFSHSCDILELIYVPNSFAVSHIKEDDTAQTQSVAIAYQGKSIQFESSITSDRHTIIFGSNGLSPLPESATAELEGNLGDNEFDFSCNLVVDGTPYKLTLSGFNRFSSGSTNFPLVSQVGEGQVQIGLVKGGESILSTTSTLTAATELLKTEFTFSQSVNPDYPHNIVEVRQLIANEREYGFVQTSTYDDSTAALDVRYSPQRLQMTQNMIESIPQELVATYEFGIEQGNFKVVSGEENLASMEYTMSESSFKVTVKHGFEYEIVPTLIELDTAYSMEVSSVNYIWGTRTGIIKFTNGLPNRANLYAKDSGIPMSVDVGYTLTQSDFEFTSKTAFEENTFDLTLGCDFNQEDRLVKLTGNAAMVRDGQESSADVVVDVVSINEVYFSVEKHCSQGSFMAQRTLTWNAEDNTISAKVEGTTRSPFLLKVTLSHNGLESATVEMTHEQDWQSVPNRITATGAVTLSDSSYKLSLDTTTDGRTRTAEATLMYNFNETGANIVAKASSEFEMIDFQNAGIVVDGNKVVGKLGGSMVLQFNGQESEDKIVVVWSEPRQFVYTFTQNFFDNWPSSGALEIEQITGGYKIEISRDSETVMSKFLISDNEMSVHAEYRSPGKNRHVGVTVTKSPIKVRLSHNLEELPVPMHVAVSPSLDEDENVIIAIETDDQASEVQIKKLKNGELVEYKFQHNLPMLPIPEDASISYRITPPEFYINWGETDAAIQLHENGFTLRQNFLDALPKSLSVVVQREGELMSSMTHQIDVKVDDYAFNHQMIYNIDQVTFTTSESLKQGETSLYSVNIDTKLSTESGHQLVEFEQSSTDYITSSFGYNVEYLIEGLSGSVDVRYGIRDPVTVTVSYSIENENQVDIHLTHNIEEIAETIPMSTSVQGNRLLSGNAMTYSAAFTSGDIRKEISLNINNKLDQMMLDVAFNHDFEQLVGYLPPFNASFDILSNGRDIDASVFYKIESGDRYLKFQASIGENEYLVTVDQKLFEETSIWRRRSHQSYVPDKAYFRVAKIDNRWISNTVFRMGPKRRYLNVTVSNPTSETRTVYKLRIEHNLNRYLPTQLPTSSLFKFVMNTTDYIAAFDLGNTEGRLQVTNDEPRYAVAFSQNLKKWTKAGVPEYVRAEINNMQITETSFHVESSFHYNEYKLSPTVDLTWDTPSFSIAGTQEGFDSIISSEDFFFKANGALESNSYEFTSSHNIDGLKAVGYPKTVTFTATCQSGIKEGNLVDTALTLVLDELEFSNNLLVQITGLSSIEITTNGVRPTSLESPEKINYSGEISMSYALVEETSVTGHIIYKETDSDSAVIRNEEVEFSVAYSGTGVTISFTVDMPSVSIDRATSSGLLSWNEGVNANASWGLAGQETSVAMNLDTTDKVHLTLAKDETNINLLIDTNAERQLEFSHNIEAFTYVPREVSIGVDTEAYSLTVSTEVQQIRVTLDLQPRSILVSYTVDDEEMVKLSGEISTHPAYQASSTIKFVPLEIDVSSSFKLQFFHPTDGKSELDIYIIDNTSHKGFHSNAYGYLNDIGIWDTSLGFLAHSNITDAEFKLDATVVLHATPFRCNIDIHYGEYSFVVSCTETSMRVSSELPESLPVHSFVYFVSNQRSEGKVVQTTTLSWNGEQKIRATSTTVFNSDLTSVGSTYELAQSFFEPNALTINYKFGEENGWTVLNAGVSEGNGRFVQIAEKWQSQTGTFNNVLDVKQSYFEFGNFIATSSITIGEASFDTDLTVTQQGEEVGKFSETFSYADQAIHYTIVWKQPFTEIIPAGFTGSLDASYDSGVIEVSSDVTHTAVSEYIPQHFTTTGNVRMAAFEYESNWKIESGGRAIVIFNKEYSLSFENGATAHLNWQHPFEHLFTPKLDYNFEGHLTEGGVHGNSQLEYTGDEGQVTIAQEANIAYTDKTRNLDFKITRNGEDIYFMDYSLKQTAAIFREQFGWRQTVFESLMRNFNASVEFSSAEGTYGVVSEITHSAETTVVPPHFTVTSHLTYSDSSFALDEKVTLPNGATFQSADFSITQTKNGPEITMDVESAIFNLNGNVVLDSGLDLTVTIGHGFESNYIPANFVTTGKVSYGEMLYDSDWTITSEGQELVKLNKKFEVTGNGVTIMLDWKQPYEDFVVTSLFLSSDIQNRDDHFRVANTLKYNSVNTWDVSYDRTSDDEHRKYVISYLVNGEGPISTFEHSSVGTKTKEIAEINIPESWSAVYGIPSHNRLVVDVTAGRKATNVTTTVESSWLTNPHVAVVAWTVHEDTVLFKGYVGFKNSAPSTPGMNVEASLTVDLENGVTVTYKLPQMGLDHEITVKYAQTTNKITIEYIANHGTPIVFTINLGDIIPTIKRVYGILKRNSILLDMKPIAYYNNDENGYELVLGVRVRDTPYTVHMLVGPETQRPSFKIVTKRRGTVVSQIISVTAEIVDMENIQIEIDVNKGLDKHLSNALGSSVAELKTKVTVIADSIVEVLRSLDNFVEGSDMIQSAIDVRRNAMIAKVTEVKTTILSFLTDMHTNSIDVLQQTEESHRSGLLMLFNAANAGVKRLLDVISQPWLDLKKSMLEEVSTQIYDEIEPMLQSIATMLKKVQAGQLFLELVEEGVSKFVFAMDKNMEALLRAAETPLSRFISITGNKIVITVPLSFKLKDRIAPPTWNDIELWITQSAFANEVRRNLQVLDKALQIYHRVKAVVNMPFDEIFPPFKGHAEMSGFRHIRTFDGQRYSYKSSCESKHLLIKDTKYHDFAVYVIYGSTPVISITLLDPTTGEQTINIKADYSVTDERDRDVIVPSDYNNVMVRRTGELISLSTNYGLVVTCNFQSELCTIDISPFYFGQVTGMLGTFNNEPSDDFTANGDEVVRNSEELAQSWMTSQSALCSGANDVPRCNLGSSEQCAYIFGDKKSPFAPCFALEDPLPYKLMCAKDTCSSTTSENGVCRAYAAYSRRCSLLGVSIPAPSACNKCKAVSGNPFNVDTPVPVTGADVIFVVERAQCLRFKKKDYKKLVTGVHAGLRESQASGSINYAVVGFGGPDGLAEPHTVTFGNQIFIESTSNRLAKSDEKRITNALKIGAKSNTDSDIMEGIRFAAQIPMRAGAARTIILITCDDCSAESKISPDTVQQLLVDQGIVLHHLRQKTIQAGRSARKIYGFNEDSIFLKSNSLSRRELRASNFDKCQQMTDLTSGSIWNSNLLKDAWSKVGEEVSRGVDSVSSQSCTCSLTDFGATAKCTDSRSRR